MSQQTNMKRNTGFTLIELMLSMTFVAILLVAIAMTFIQIATVYNRGMTLKEVNQSARDISDDMRRTFASSQVFMVNTDGSDSADYVTVKSGAAIVGGRLCTGTYSYAWNIAKAIEGADTNLTRVLNVGGVAQYPIRFVRIPDNDKIYCLKTGGSLTNRNINDADAKQMTDLLDAGDHALALQSFSVSTADSAFDVLTKQRLYSVTYTVGSGATSAMNLAASPIKCLDPGSPNANPVYCNVQQFTIVLRVGNTVN
ncbi:MAG: PulJ/GspJ family protein [Candidatus Saccharimonadaceae bacterium]